MLRDRRGIGWFETIIAISHGELAGAIAHEQVVEAVLLLRRTDRDAALAIAVEPVVHAEAVRQLAHAGFELDAVRAAREIEP